MATRSVVVRERNERGFRNFLQNLKAVFRLFLTPGNGNLTNNALVEARHYLLDARGTLSLLIIDLEKGDPNPTRLPASTLLAPLQNLNESVVQMISMLPVEIESRQQTENSDQNTAYSTSVTTHFGPGRRCYDISRDPLEHLRSLFSLGKKIADMLQVSVSTIQRRHREFGLSDEFERYSDLSDNELDQIYASVTGNSHEGSPHP